MGLSSKDRNDLNRLRKEALALLEWTMEDISPVGHHLHVKCGVERELHYLRDEDVDLLKTDIKKLTPSLDAWALTIFNKICDEGVTTLERLYHDHAGLFLLETVTKPIGLLAAAESTIDATKRLKDIAKQHNHRCDADLDVTDISQGFLPDSNASFCLDGASFPIKVDGKQYRHLVGCGQHANVSIGLGDDINLFAEDKRLMKDSAKWAAAMLPDMILPSRDKNYHHIASDALFSPQIINASSDNKYSGNAIRIIEKNLNDSGDEEHIPAHQARLEFRQAASNADPHDVVLAAAAPLVRVCLKTLAFDDGGKVKLNSAGLPIHAKNTDYFSSTPIAMPRNAEEATKMFNVKDNTYCTFLDELVVRKLARLQAQKIPDMPNRTLDEQIGQARDLQNIGTKMHHLYCHEYGIESVMPLPSRVAGVA